MIGTTLAHYRITAALGAGGMGEVWRATDTKLGRDVALKVLPEAFVDDPQRLDRFEREARAVAALNHPHIVTIYSVEEAEGTRFLTMELIEGRSLDKLIPDGGLELEKFFDLATPLAEAISAAHDKSVIHRDLKPTNVMVDGDGRVKVLDFGLAKLQQPGEVSDSTELPTEALTGVGVIVGTVPYMSPEQIEGKIVDHRTDIFSLGILLYEMALGERPFQGESSVGLMSSILRDAPAPVGERRDDLPNHLGRIISRCLEKDRRDRYQTARDVFNELKALRREAGSVDSGFSQRSTARKQSEVAPISGSSGAMRSKAPWIAVVPFSYPGGDADLETFADGIEEDIATGLSRFSYLHVIARDSTRRDRDRTVDSHRIAAEPGASFVVKGGVRAASGTIRVSVQLVDAENEAQLWAETYDRSLDAAGIFELQDEITGKTVATVADSYGILIRSIEAGLQAKTETEYAPWEWLIRLFGYRQRPTSVAHAKLRDGLEEAVERDANHAEVWACLSQIYLDEHGFGFNVRPDAPGRALTAAQRAVDIDRASQLGYQVLAQSLFFRHDLKAFRSAAERAMSLNPRDSNTMGILGLLIVLSGDFEYGADITRRAMELNPHHAGWYHFGPIWESFHNRDYEKALEHAKQVNMPGMFGPHLVVAAACGHLGRHAEAEEAVNDLLAFDPDIAFHARENIEKWHFASGLLEPLMDGLRKAGLKMVTAEGEDTTPASVIPPDAPAKFEKRTRAVFVGRDDERAALDRMLEEAAAGRGGLVLLGGEPGVGKTRLASEILEDGRERGILALAGHAYEDETAPFVTSSEILEEMVRLVPAIDLRRMLGDNASELARLLPELRTIFPDIPEPADVPPEMLQRHLFKNVLEFLTRGSAEQPMVMLFDDIHWADESSLLLLEHIAPRLAELPILMIGTYRDVEADIGKPFARSMTTLVRQRLAERITVRPFDEGSVADLLTALGGSAPPASLAHAIHDATEGNVFFIEETFRHLSEEGLLFDESGAWRADIDVEHLDVPEGVRLVTARRIERLSESTQKILSLASVIGLRFPVEVLEAAAVDSEAVVDAVEEAEAAHLLQPATGGRALRYEFVHALARQTLLSELSAIRRQRMHLVIADAIEKIHGANAERSASDLAYHLVESGASADSKRTVRWLTAAGENAGAAAAVEEAVQYFDRALSLLGGEQAEVRSGLLYRRGSARLRLGQRDECTADLTEAFDGFESLGLGEQAAAVASELSYILVTYARPSDAKALIARALALIGGEDSVARCELLSAQGLAHGMASEPSAAERIHEAAIPMARTLARPALLAKVLENQSLDRWHVLDGVTAERSAHEAATIRRDLRQEWNLGQCLWREKTGLVLQGRYDEAERVDDELHPLARRNDDVLSLALLALMNGIIQQARGNIAESSRQLRLSIELFDAGGFPWGPLNEGYDSVNALLTGEFDSARAGFDRAVAHRLPANCWSGAEDCYQLSGKARLGDPDTYRLFESLRPKIPLAGETVPAGTTFLLLGAIEALVLIGRADEAATLYPAIRSLVSSGISVQSFTYGLHERFAGMAAAAAREWGAAEAHFQAALKLAEDLPHRVDQARVRYWYARALLDRGEPGDSERARQMLTEARELSEEMSLHGLIEQIEGVGAGSDATR